MFVMPVAITNWVAGKEAEGWMGKGRKEGGPRQYFTDQGPKL